MDEIPREQAGGQYTIKVTYPSHGHHPAERIFDMRAYRAPRLKTQIQFLRDGCDPGDLVAATLEVERAEGGVPAGAKVTVIARVDGKEAYRGKARVDNRGNCRTEFRLPSEIRRGEGTLAMVVEDGGVVETASKTIPILLQMVDLTMYPEGGDLVAGLPNRVYFEAFTPSKKPADLAGIVVGADGRQVAAFRSEHEGRGRFEFTRERRALHTWVADPECSNAYIVWSLLESGDKEDLSREVAWVRDAAEKTENTYVVALAANVLAMAGDADGANRLLDRLAGRRSPWFRGGVGTERAASPAIHPTGRLSNTYADDHAPVTGEHGLDTLGM